MSDNLTEYDVTAAHIVQAPNIHNGRPFIVNSSVLVQDVYVWHELVGCYAADEIAAKYNLTMAQVYAALTFAFDHLDEIERYMKVDQQLGRGTRLPSDFENGSNGSHGSNGSNGSNGHYESHHKRVNGDSI